MASPLTRIASWRCFDGDQLHLTHASAACASMMTLSVYLPPQARTQRVPVLWWLSGLTCTDQNFVTKAGAQRYAAEHGVALVVPDTSPRGPDVPADPDGAWDFGLGAGFYVDATEAPWSTHYRMYTYIRDELPTVLAELPLDFDRQAISGHSMGGHGALVLALRNPGRYRSVSAFSPIVAPSEVPWGVKAFGRYLGPDRAAWKAYDATALVETAGSAKLPLLVDQGLADSFLDTQLQPGRLEEACARAGHPLTLRRQPGYDHSYYFIATFIGDHVAWHAAALKK
ncbi:MAG: S-formylglutathione hydrolase [Pseudomonadota bacterium]|nr:S-formylglutathione hydrolase [Pseudomonadota bacterium]